MRTYQIVRYFRNDRPSKLMKEGLTLREAQTHCKDELTHKLDKEGIDIWFDGYRLEDK